MSDMIKIQVRQKIKSFGIRTHIKKERTHMSDMKIRRLVLAALFAALCTVMTLVIQVPSPMQG